MKKLMLLISILVVCGAGCTKKDPIQAADLKLSSGMQTEVVLDSQGEMKSVRFTSAKAWHVEVDGEAPWLDITPMEGEAGNGRVKMQADVNLSGSERKAEFRICSDDKFLQFTVTQDNFEPIFEVVETDVSLPADGGLAVVHVNTNLKFTCSISEDWVLTASSDEAFPEYVVFGAGPNPNSASRDAEITLKSEIGSYTVTLTQDACAADADSWKAKSFVDRSLAMRFTATWCGWCPYMGKAFEQAKTDMNGSLEIVCLHGGGSDLDFSGTAALMNRFSIDSFPTGIVDCRASVPNSTDPSETASLAEAVAKETEVNYPAQSGISCSSFLSGSELTVLVTNYFKQADSYRVVVLLLEDGIIGYQSGATANYVHNDVARAALTSMSGSSVKITEDNPVWTGMFTSSIKVSNPDNLKVLVYVEKPYGDQPLVEGVDYVRYDNYGGSYVDNCRVVPVGEYAELELK